jgi:hypothetical protein
MFPSGGFAASGCARRASGQGAITIVQRRKRELPIVGWHATDWAGAPTRFYSKI